MASEWLTPHQGAGDGPIQVQISHVKVPLRQVEIGRTAGIDSTGQSVIRRIGQPKGLLKGGGFHDGQDRSKDLLLRDPRARIHISEEGGTDVPAWCEIFPVFN